MEYWLLEKTRESKKGLHHHLHSPSILMFKYASHFYGIIIFTTDQKYYHLYLSQALQVYSSINIYILPKWQVKVHNIYKVLYVHTYTDTHLQSLWLDLYGR